MTGIIGYITHLLIIVGIYGILTLTLNFQAGFTGLVNFGHVMFFCVGAYASTLLVMLAGAPFILGLLGAFVVGGIFGFLISLPTGNLKEDYWAIATLAAAEIIRLFFVNESWIYPGEYMAGPFGIRGIPSPLKSFFTPTTYPYFYLLIVLVALGITYLTLTHLISLPFGRVLKAIREGDDLPLALGKNTFRFKMQSMAITGAFAGSAGSLYAHYVSFIDPYTFMPIITFLVWAMVVVGGRGNSLGSIVGVVAIQLFYTSTRYLDDYLPLDTPTVASLRMVAIGVLIVLVMLFLREGIIPEKKRVYEYEPTRGEGTKDSNR